MFGKKQTGATIVGRGDALEGTLRIGGSLHVDGEIEGNVEAEGQVSIGPDGVVRGEIHGEDIAVAGRVEGTVVARGHLHMLSSGHIKGDATFNTLQVDRGGVIHGHTASSAERAEATAEDGAKKPVRSSEAPEPVAS